VDSRLNRLAALSDFAALVYVFMVPHADDAGMLHGDIEELMAMVMPMRRDKTAEDFGAALTSIEAAGLVEWDRPAATVSFPAHAFYLYQSYIKAENRRSTGERPPTPAIAEEQRATPENAEERRSTPEKAVSDPLSDPLSDPAPSSFSAPSPAPPAAAAPVAADDADPASEVGLASRLAALGCKTPKEWLSRFGAARCGAALALFDRAEKVRSPAGFVFSLLASGQDLALPPNGASAAVAGHLQDAAERWRAANPDDVPAWALTALTAAPR
jgi:hypothetical protein